MKDQKLAKPHSNQEILFLPSNMSVPADPNKTVLEVAMRYKVPLNHSCGGMGICTTCRVFVLEGLEKIGPRTETESERAEERFFSDNERLSCQITAVPGLVLKIP